MSRSFVPALAVLFAVACNGSSPSAPVVPEPSPTAAPTPEPTATPAALGPGSISYIRVGFYGIECNNGQKAPSNNAKKLPVGCYGYVTATPKHADGTDVAEDEHGPEIAWDVAQGDYAIRVFDDERQPFNKVVRGRAPGIFSLCATVRTVRGCLDAEVVP